MTPKTKRTIWDAFRIAGAFSARRFTTTFLAGLTAILPLVITVLLIVFIGGYVYAWLKSLAGLIDWISFQLFGTSAPHWIRGLMYITSLVITIVLIWLLGYLTRLYIGKRLAVWFETIIGKIPLINTLYSSVDQVLDLFTKKGESRAAALSTVVLMRFANTQLLGMLANTDPVEINGVPHFLVYIPSAPMPTSGFNYLAPCTDVTNINITAEELTRVIVSLGSLGPQTMNAKHPLILPVPGEEDLPADAAPAP